MKKLSIILIFAGVLIAAVPFAGGGYTAWQDKKLMEQWTAQSSYQQLNAAFSEEATAAEPSTEASPIFTVSATAISITATSAAALAANTTPNAASVPSTAALKAGTSARQTLLGVIRISKINVKYPIVEGTDAKSLSSAIGHIEGTADPGQSGNCALAGHRSYTFGKYFNRLDELREGDKIELITKEARFIYMVYEKLVVLPDDVSVIEGSKEETLLTLITCTPVRVATHRLILHARLDHVIPAEH